MSFIWATRGRSWGFRFLRSGGFDDPLLEYEAAFAGAGSGASIYQRIEDKVALRFPDPEGRKDAAGRVIPHEFVLFGALAAEVGSVGDALEEVWPLVAEEYKQLWGRSNPQAED